MLSSAYPRLTVDRNPASNATCHTFSFHPTQHSQLILRHPIDTHQLRLEDCPKPSARIPTQNPRKKGTKKKKKNPRKKPTKRAPRRNRPHRPLPIPKLRRDGQGPLIPNAHVQQALVPPLDDLALADGEVQRLAAVVAGVELGAVGGEGAAVVDGDAVAALGLAGARVLHRVFGRDFGAEGEGEEEGEEGEGGEAHGWGGFFLWLGWWCFFSRE